MKTEEYKFEPWQSHRFVVNRFYPFDLPSFVFS